MDNKKWQGPKLELVHSSPRRDKGRTSKGLGPELPAEPLAHHLSPVLERVETQLLEAFSKASPYLTNRVVSTESAEYFVDELLAKSLVRRVRRVLLRSSWGRCLYALEDQTGFISTYTLTRSFYIKVASRLRKLAGVEAAIPNPIKKGLFYLGFEGADHSVQVELTSKLSDFGEFVSLDFLWQDG